MSISGLSGRATSDTSGGGCSCVGSAHEETEAGSLLKLSFDHGFAALPGRGQIQPLRGGLSLDIASIGDIEGTAVDNDGRFSSPPTAAGPGWDDGRDDF
jgi:hypothetical protein